MSEYLLMVHRQSSGCSVQLLVVHGTGNKFFTFLRCSCITAVQKLVKVSEC